MDMRELDKSIEKATKEWAPELKIYFILKLYTSLEDIHRDQLFSHLDKIERETDVETLEMLRNYEGTKQ